MRLLPALFPFVLACSEYSFKGTTDALPGADTGIPGPGDVVEPVDEVFEVSLELEVNKIDVAFLLDTTCSMSSTANAVASEYAAIVSDLELTVGDAAYGFATYDDYHYGGMGAPEDLPFILQQQVTTDYNLVQAALNAVEIHNGNDLPESTMEGLYQGLTGAGYDQDGNGYFDPTTDVRPFIADPSDPFGGSVEGTFDPTTPGGGELGGYGFRDGSLPVIVYATDAQLRDPDSGYETPPFANKTAGRSDVAAAAREASARLIGIGTQTSTPVAQMNALAIATDSLYAADSDGLVNDPLVLTWTGSSSAFRNTVVNAVRSMLQSVSFSSVSAELVGNTYGFDTEVTPEAYNDISVGTSVLSLDFEVSVIGEVPASTERQRFPMTLNIYGDGTTLLATRNIVVVVPASL